MLWILLLSSGLLLLLLTVVLLIWLYLMSVKKTNNQMTLTTERVQTAYDQLVKEIVNSQRQEIQRVEETNRDLLNRMMAQDLPAYTTMTVSNHSDSNPYQTAYVPMTDAAEAVRIAQVMATTNGFGEAAFDEQTDVDANEILKDIGAINFDSEGQR